MGGFSSESSNDYFAGNLDYALYAYYGDPARIERMYSDGTGIAKTVVPIWQIVYNGIITSNPFTITINPTIKDRKTQLKAIEFSARPSFYFYSKFKSNGDSWMGREDLGCATYEELKWSVSKIKEAYDVYMKLKHLQLEFITNHTEPEPGIRCTSYSNGQKIIVNYNDKPVNVDGVEVPAMDYVLL
ncbi:MAG: hypothetical protein KBS57_02495 [Alistipes sp.]|nr:hypothetical protein [Candidatus Minthomonas equi]